MKKKIAIVGESIAAMIAAIELSKKNSAITIFKQSRNWGGHFWGVDFGEQVFDVGMCVLEFTENEVKADVNTYNINVRNDVARFLGNTKEYISNLIPIKELKTPECYFKNNYYDDFLLSNSLEVLNAFSNEQKEELKKSCRNAIQIGGLLHPRNKNQEQDFFLKESYENLSIQNNGELIHNEIIDVFLNKCVFENKKDISALLHRITWTPAYYPETILNFLELNKSNIPVAKYHYPANGTFRKIIEGLKSKFEQSNLQVVEKQVSSITKKQNKYIIEANDISSEFDEIIWGSNIDQLTKVLDLSSELYKEKKANLKFAFCLVPKESIKKIFSTIFLCDTETPAYRITNLDYDNNLAINDRLIIEFNPDYLDSLNIEHRHTFSFTQMIKKMLFSIGLLHKEIDSLICKIIDANQAMNLPTENNYLHFHSLKDCVTKNFPEIKLIGPSSGVETKSINDQIIQALQVSQQIDN